MATPIPPNAVPHEEDPPVSFGQMLAGTSLALRAFLALALLLPAMLAGWFAWHQHQAVLDEMHTQMQRASIALEEHAASVFETHTLILRQVALLVTGKPWEEIERSEGLKAILADFVKRFDQVAMVGIADARGQVRISSATDERSSFSIADRDYFLAHAGATPPPVFFGETFVGAQDGISQFAVSIPRLNPNGGFDGVIFATVPIAYFTDFWRQFVPSDRYLIPLARDDGALIVRFPAKVNPERLDPDGPFLGRAHRTPMGIYTAVSLVDGIERTNAYRQIRDLPLYISFSVESREMLQRWQDEVLPVLLLSGIAAAALIALWTAVVRQAYRQRESASRWQDAARRLENEIARREAAEEALRHGQKMEAIGQLAGGIAHDFNNLLAGVVGNLQLMRVRLAQGRIDDIAARVDAAEAIADRAKSVTQRLLAFSRRQALRPAVTSVNERIEFMQDLIQRTVGPKVDLCIELDSAAGPTLCDSNQLEIALLNLAINARDAMPAGGTLRIVTRSAVIGAADSAQGAAPGRYVTIAVSDTGTGMPPDVVARVFDPFFTTKPVGKGTGLGLSMIYGFVKQSGGEVRIESVPGAGTTVYIDLPVATTDAPEVEREAESAHTPRAPWPAAVLLVEDEASLREVLATTLMDLDYQVIQCTSADEGYAILQSGTNADLVVTDVGLPGNMDGKQLADAVRKLRPNQKVLIMTGYPDRVPGGADLNDSELLCKPFALRQFAETVYELVNASHSHDQQVGS